MGRLVCMGAMLQCSLGMAPSALVVLPLHRVLSGTPDANIMDHQPLLNILPFGLCQSLANPAVAAATAAAMGVLTPMPCLPATTTPWLPGAATVMLGGMPALHDGCSLMCLWGGLISVQSPGQFTVSVGS